jgi:hypothetical protein
VAYRLVIGGSQEKRSEHMGMHRHPEYGEEVDELYWKWKQKEAADEALGGIKLGLEATLDGIICKYGIQSFRVDDGGKIELLGKIIARVELAQKDLRLESEAIHREAERLIYSRVQSQISMEVGSPQ